MLAALNINNIKTYRHRIPVVQVNKEIQKILIIQVSEKAERGSHVNRVRKKNGKVKIYFFYLSFCWSCLVDLILVLGAPLINCDFLKKRLTIYCIL